MPFEASGSRGSGVIVTGLSQSANPRQMSLPTSVAFQPCHQMKWPSPLLAAMSDPVLPPIVAEVHPGTPILADV